jgi:Predicted integral membrane protein
MKKLSIDNPFFRFMDKTGDVVIINLLFLACLVPVITAGASVSAMYEALNKMGQDNYISAYRSFKNAFISSIKKSIPVWLLSLITGTVLTFDLMLVTKAQPGMFWHITGMVAGCLMFLWLLITCWLFPAGIYKGNSIKDAVKRSLFLAVRNFPYTMLMLVLDLIPVICLAASDYYTALAAPVYFVAGFGLTALINNKIMDRCAV